MKRAIREDEHISKAENDRVDLIWGIHIERRMECICNVCMRGWRCAITLDGFLNLIHLVHHSFEATNNIITVPDVIKNRGLQQ